MGSSHHVSLLFFDVSMLQKKAEKPILPLSASTISICSAFEMSFSSVKSCLLLLSTFFIIYLLARPSPSTTPLPFSSLPVLSPISRRHLLFSIASSSKSWSRRKPYVRLWYNRDSTRAFAYLDSLVPNLDPDDPSVPPALASHDTSDFPYTFVGGLRSAIRVARMVKEIVDRGEEDVRWFVFGDDDTLFFVDNLVMTLGKYDHRKWFYIGSSSESYEQNLKDSFEMAFGGGGFAISSSLARVLARVMDSCLMRYPHLYGSDSRIFSCVTELGVSLTHEPGFHQVDMRGNLFGMLSAHPLSPIVSLHHLDAMEPIFPNMTTTQALEHLFEAVTVDSARIFQQTVCYDRSNALTFSVSWGYAIQVFDGNELLSNLLSLQRTFMPWRRSHSPIASYFMFNTRNYPRDLCKRPIIFYMENISSVEKNVWGNYNRHMFSNCSVPDSMKKVQHIRVATQKLEHNPEQAPRRHCCNLVPSSNDESILLNIRRCKEDELISMHV